MKKSVAGVLLGILMTLIFANFAGAAVLYQQSIADTQTSYWINSNGMNQYLGSGLSGTFNAFKVKALVEGSDNYWANFLVRINCVDEATAQSWQYVISNSNCPGWPSSGINAVSQIHIQGTSVQEYTINFPDTTLSPVKHYAINFLYANGYYPKVKFFGNTSLNGWPGGVQGDATRSCWETTSNCIPLKILYFVLEGIPFSLKMPFSNGTSHYCTQGANGSYSHQASSTKYDLDLATSQSTDEDVVAAASGTAYTHAGSTGFGNHISIDHSNGYFTLYAHLKSFGVANGQSVSQGQVIGKEDCTGSPCTGDHLHFGLHTGDPTINALNSTSVLAEKITTKDVTAGGSFVEITSDEFICEDPDGTGHFYESNNTAP